jgi:hypothetical protein
MHTYIHTRIYLYSHICTYIYIHIYIYIYARTYNVNMYIYTHLCNLCMYDDIWIYFAGFGQVAKSIDLQHVWPGFRDLWALGLHVNWDNIKHNLDLSCWTPWRFVLTCSAKEHVRSFRNEWHIKPSAAKAFCAIALLVAAASKKTKAWPGSGSRDGSLSGLLFIEGRTYMEISHFLPEIDHFAAYLTRLLVKYFTLLTCFYLTTLWLPLKCSLECEKTRVKSGQIAKNYMAIWAIWEIHGNSL